MEIGKDHDLQFLQWASLSIGAGGLLMAVFWIASTTAHSPTSFYVERTVLGRSMLFWGMMFGGPPFIVPILGIGLILMARGSRHNPWVQKQKCYSLMPLGILLMMAFGWALIPLEVTDQVGGFRLYGLVANFATGIVWVMLGMRFWRMPVSIHRD